MKTHHHLTLLAVGTAAALQMAPRGHAQGSQASYSIPGSTYTQNFDSLPYTPGMDVNTADPQTIGGTEYTVNGGAYTNNTSTTGTFDFAAAVDSSGTTATSTGGFGLSATMPGWYGGAATALKVGAQSGSQTTGGIISFGTSGGTNDGNRALGLLATSSTGITFFGVKLVNLTSTTINSVSLSFTGELWHQGAAKPLNYGYFVDTNLADSIPMTTTAIGSISSASGATTTTVNTTGPLATIPESNAVTLATPWTANSALWLVFEESTNASSSQGFAIDNFSFASVPEPSTWTMLVGGVVGLLAFAWRRVRGAAAAC